MWHFGFPILFTFTALPWPVWMEDHLVQTLTRWDTDVSAELLTLLGTPALAVGNLIQVGSSWVNVEEACSGIRSLQTAFMMSLFLGEFYRLGIVSRVFLMLSSFAVAFGLNIIRTMTLTSLSGAQGPAAIDKWHDTLGTAVMLLCLAGLWFLALGFEKLDRHLSWSAPAAKKPRVVPTAPVPFPFPVGFVVFGLAWLVTAEATTEAWYRYHEAKLVSPAEWGVRWPEKSLNYKAGEFPDRTRAILKYNEAETSSWNTSEGYGWQMYYIRWFPGRVSKFLSSAHYPTVCLPATGLKFVSETGRYLCPAGKIEIPFTTFLFKSGEQDVYVFHAIIEDRPAPDGEAFSYHQVDSSERINSVLRGHRNLGQRVLGISLIGPLSLEEAKATVRKTLDEIISQTPTQTAQKR
jgi:exosortase/archaeosortase family protein